VSRQSQRSPALFRSLALSGPSARALSLTRVLFLMHAAARSAPAWRRTTPCSRPRNVTPTGEPVTLCTAACGD
jgi:hypothetical protein